MIHISNLLLGAMLEENIINRNIGEDFTEFAIPPLSSITQPKPPPLLNACVLTLS